MKIRGFILSFLIIFFTSISYAQLRIEVTEGISEPIRIAIVPISWNIENPPRIYLHEIISSDLESFGEFEALIPQEMLSFPTTEEEIFYRDWRLLKVDFVVIGFANKGEVSKEVEVSFSIINIA